MKKVIVAVLALVMVFTMTSCKPEPSINPYITEQTISKNERITDYDSPYTLCFKNKDNTYTVYMFSSPISYKNEQGAYEFIDNHIIDNQSPELLEKGYIYQNAKNSFQTYLPDKDDKPFFIKNGENSLEYSLIKENEGASNPASLRTIKNMYGDSLQSVMYKNSDDNISLNTYVTKAGIKHEVVFNACPSSNILKFKVKSLNYYPECNGNGYAQFRDYNNSSKLGWLIYSGLMKDSSEKTYSEKDSHLTSKTNMSVDPVEDTDDEYIITITLDNDFLTNKNTVYPVRLDTSFETYQNKQPDSGVYSGNGCNAYLSPISIIGNSPSHGIGRQYIRFRFEYFFAYDPSTILSSTYHLHEFTNFNSEEKVSLNLLNEQWSSTNLTWNNKIDFDEEAANTSVSHSGDIAFDITDYTKKCFSDQSMMTESYGLVLKGSEESNRFRVFSSSDNAEYPPYIKMNLIKLPDDFQFRENINPTN